MYASSHQWTTISAFIVLTTFLVYLDISFFVCYNNITSLLNHTHFLIYFLTYNSHQIWLSYIITATWCIYQFINEQLHQHSPYQQLSIFINISHSLYISYIIIPRSITPHHSLTVTICNKAVVVQQWINCMAIASPSPFLWPPL